MKDVEEYKTAICHRQDETLVHQPQL